MMMVKARESEREGAMEVDGVEKVLARYRIIQRGERECE